MLLLSTPLVAGQGFGDRFVAGTFAQEELPLTEDAARAGNWTLLDTTCTPGVGRRWRLGDRLTPTLLFSAAGKLAGMQTSVDAAMYPLHPSSNLRPEIFQEPESPSPDTERAMSLLFTDPAQICGSPTDLGASVADRFWIKTGLSSAAVDYEHIPLSEQELVNGMPYNGYSAGGCAPSGFAFPGSPGMGQHYWKYLGSDLPCNDLGALFLLYTDGKLNGYGIPLVNVDMKVPTVNGDFPSVHDGHYGVPGSLWEFPHQPLYPLFIKEGNNPTCMPNINAFDAAVEGGAVTVATMHFYFTNALNLSCSAVPLQSSAQVVEKVVEKVVDAPSSSCSSCTLWVVVAVVLAVLLAAALVGIYLTRRTKCDKEVKSVAHEDYELGADLCD